MKTKILSIITLLAVLFASCQKDDTPPINHGDGEVTFTSGIATRASGIEWHADDKIGVYMIATGVDGGVYNMNVMCRNTSAAGSTAEGIMIPQDITNMQLRFATVSHGSSTVTIGSVKLAAGTTYTYNVTLGENPS